MGQHPHKYLSLLIIFGTETISSFHLRILNEAILSEQFSLSFVIALTEIARMGGLPHEYIIDCYMVGQYIYSATIIPVNTPNYKRQIDTLYHARIHEMNCWQVLAEP
ncbi:hypothetical protein LOAG_07959 [Loa loa]|uniref:Uncharacterized protein n=1 Tax=Loa loa TaxID=7209 RepID=A0A1S0TUQ3_LOALO|nr:hypothetical protein LOAG_07959 [Loa loa]EFO20533.1 hypothetical protein LOAG_07959 [Loa loa]